MRALLASTFIFGVIPASPLVLFAVLLGIAPIYALFEPGVPPWAALGLVLTVPLGAMAVFGYMGLFEAVAGTLTHRVARWLLAGVVADLIGIVLVTRLWWSVLAISCLFVPPLLVSCAHLAQFLRGARDRRASV